MKSKYKIFIAHFVMWMVYIIVNIVLYRESFVEFCFWIFTHALFFYFLYFIVSPRIITKPTVKRMAVWFLVCLVLYYLFQHLRDDLYFVFMVEEKEYNALSFYIGEEFVAYLSFAPQSLGLRLYHDWLLNVDENESLEIRKSTTQLQSYKNKIDLPSINNVLQRMETMATHKASSVQDSIIDLSNVLRYNIYESCKDKATLGQELEIIKSQISLNNNLYNKNVKLTFSEEWDHVFIEPGVMIKVITEFLKINPRGECLKLIVIDDRLNLLIEDSTDRLMLLKEKLQTYVPQFISISKDQTNLQLKLAIL